jgi:hypothetical protein
MAHEWKAGDRAVVEITHGGTPYIGVNAGSGSLALFMPNALTPLPAPDPHADKRAAVAEAAMAYITGGCATDLCDILINACYTLRAALTPPDPMEELKAAWEAAYKEVATTTRISDDTCERVDNAISAVAEALKQTLDTHAPGWRTAP